VTVWYRITDHATSAGTDECGDPLPGPGGVAFTVEEYETVKETPQGVWLKPRCWRITGSVHGSFGEDSDLFWIKRDAHRRYACPTMAEAVESFLARKDKQARIYEARARYARRAALEAKKRWQSLTAEEDLELLAS
jgi:hypothetical protein